MGLLSKLFGNDKEVEKAAKDILDGLFGQNPSEKRSADEAAYREPVRENSWDSDSRAVQEPEFRAPEGASYGPYMPAEENQFSYQGSWWEYFENIFRTEFPQYRIEKESTQGSNIRIIYTFLDGERKALVVELMPESSASKKLRERCQKQGIPYLRYYYNHDGWWNTRSYVTNRTKAALGI